MLIESRTAVLAAGFAPDVSREGSAPARGARRRGPSEDASRRHRRRGRPHRRRADRSRHRALDRGRDGAPAHALHGLELDRSGRIIVRAGLLGTRPPRGVRDRRQRAVSFRPGQIIRCPASRRSPSQQGRHARSNILLTLRGKPREPFHYGTRASWRPLAARAPSCRCTS